MEFRRWERESIILKGTKRIDPDEQLERRLSDRRGVGVEASDGLWKDKRKEREKGKGKGKVGEKEGEAAAPRVSAAVGGDTHNDEAASGGGGLSTYNDIPSGNGETARPKVEDHYGFLHSISERDIP